MTSLMWVVVALLGESALLLGSVLMLEIMRPEGYNTAALYTVIGIVAPVFAVLVNIFKSHFNAQTMKKEVEAVKEEVVQVKKATEDVSNKIA